MTLPDAPSAPAALDHAAVRSVVFGIMLAMFLGALDQTIVATALPTIGRRFGEVENLSWVVTAYLLSATASTPLYGKLSDIHGRRVMMLVAIGIFAAGSVACALAPSLTALIFARGLQGLGGGGLLSLSHIIIGDVIAPKERGRYQGYFGFVFAVASVGGPVAGGILAEHLHWSLIFWINIPIGAVALAMTYRALSKLPRHERPHKLDLIGAFLVVAATVAFMMALTWGGTRYPWGSAAIMALLGGSIVLFVLFAVRISTAPEPFLPPAVLANAIVRRGILSVACVFGTMIGLSIFVPLYFEVVLHLSASESGLVLIPLMGGTVVGATVSGRRMSRIAHYKRLPIIGLAVAVAGIAVLALKPEGLPLPVIAMALGVAGLGMGAVFPGHHRIDPERGATLAARHDDRHDELLSSARRCARRRGLRRDRARRRHGAGRSRGAGGDRRPRGRQSRGDLPLGVRRRRRHPRGRARLPRRDGGTALAQRRRGARSRPRGW